MFTKLRFDLEPSRWRYEAIKYIRQSRLVSTNYYFTSFQYDDAEPIVSTFTLLPTQLRFTGLEYTSSNRKGWVRNGSQSATIVMAKCSPVGNRHIRQLSPSSSTPSIQLLWKDELLLDALHWSNSIHIGQHWAQAIVNVSLWMKAWKLCVNRWTSIQIWWQADRWRRAYELFRAVDNRCDSIKTLPLRRQTDLKSVNFCLFAIVVYRKNISTTSTFTFYRPACLMEILILKAS